MSASSRLVLPPSIAGSSRLAKTIALGIVLLVAIAFISRYVFYYYLHYSEAGFMSSAPHFWRLRFWLLLHITSGMTALLIGPWQFSQRLRQRFLQFHRISGRVYLVAIILGATASFRLASGSPESRAWSFGLMMLGVAWLITSGMAFYAIRRRQILIHKQWMVRSYVVTFAFVTFRLFNDYPPMSTWLPDADRANVIIWACWAVPLLIAEVIMQLNSIPRINTRS